MKRWGDSIAELRSLIGDECLSRLVAHRGGRTLRIPTARSLERQRRRERVQGALDDGASYREVARDEAVALSTVCRTAKRSA